jgi:hypothetical protein
MTTFEFNSQICTTKEQSETLLKLGLKKETADMSWIFSYHWECYVGNPEELYTPDEDGCDDVYIPAWSLHRILLLLNCSYIELDANNPFEDCITRIEFMIKENKIFNQDYLEKK